MQKSSLAAQGALATRVRRGGRRGRAQLAAVPDEREQDRLRSEADTRARALVAAADLGGAPLVDANGTRRSHVTLPEFTRGRAPANKGRRYPAGVLTTEEVLAILDRLPKGTSKTGARNRALIVVMWRAGLRIAEALALEPRDIDVALGTITVRHGKGAKRRVVAIDAMTQRHLADILERRNELCLDAPELRARLQLNQYEEVPVFCTLSGPGLGRPLHASTVREMLKLYARKAGIRKRVHPHGLRHTFAFQLSQEKFPVAVIQQQLGHEDLEMTAHYLDHLAPGHLIETIGQRACPDDPGPAPAPVTRAAMSGGKPAPSSGPSPLSLLPPEPPRAPRGAALAAKRAGIELDEQILAVLASNGGRATTGQLRRGIGASPRTALAHLHRLHAQGRVIRVGYSPGHRAILWKLAPPTVKLRPARRIAQRGAGAGRVLNAIDALDGRASQAEIGRTLELAPATVQGYCRELEAEGLIERGGLDKSTSRRGSQIWKLPTVKPRFAQSSGFTMTLRIRK